MRKPLVVIFATIALDAVGIGLVFPILPRLLDEVTHTRSIAVMPIFALGGIGTPALQSRAARLVDPSRHGQFQGVLASAVSLASIVAPLAFSTFYFVVQKEWPGAIWLSVVVVNAIAVPLVVLGTRNARPPQAAGA